MNIEDLREQLDNADRELAKMRRYGVDPHRRNHRELINYRERVARKIEQFEYRQAERERIEALPTEELVARIPRG